MPSGAVTVVAILQATEVPAAAALPDLRHRRREAAGFEETGTKFRAGTLERKRRMGREKPADDGHFVE